MEAAGTYKITRQGQITIPSKVRDNLHLTEGDVLDFYYSNDIIVIKKKREPIEVFEDVAASARQRFKARGLSRKDVERAVKAARK